MTGSVLLFAQLPINPPIRLTNSLEVRLWEVEISIAACCRLRADDGQL